MPPPEMLQRMPMRMPPPEMMMRMPMRMPGGPGAEMLRMLPPEMMRMAGPPPPEMLRMLPPELMMRPPPPEVAAKMRQMMGGAPAPEPLEPMNGVDPEKEEKKKAIRLLQAGNLKCILFILMY